MSIRPVDYISLISKSQEVSKVRQVQNDQFRIQIEQGATQQHKRIKKNIKTVRDINKSENLNIDANKKETKMQKNKKKMEKMKRKMKKK